MRALAHPTRLALLEVLAVHGPMTATEAGGYVDESPSSCSYHLRLLARHGFVEEADGGTGRQRPWRRVDMGTSIGLHDDPETKVAAQALRDVYLERYLTRLRAAMAADRDEQPRAWRRVTPEFSESVLWLTAAEAKAMNDEIIEILLRHEDRLADPDKRPDGAQPVEMLYFAYRTDFGPPTET
jgi:DNA-binding transcriptional ArsR family regulator